MEGAREEEGAREGDFEASAEAAAMLNIVGEAGMAESEGGVRISGCSGVSGRRCAPVRLLLYLLGVHEPGSFHGLDAESI
jgi:hypothetical protein